MTDKTPATLDRLWDDIPTGPAPIGDLLTAGHTVNCRKRNTRIAGVAAATAVLIGGVATQQTLTSTTGSNPVAEPSTASDQRNFTIPGGQSGKRGDLVLNADSQVSGDTEPAFDAMTEKVDAAYPGFVTFGGAPTAAPDKDGMRWLITTEKPITAQTDLLATYPGPLHIYYGNAPSPESMREFADDLRQEFIRRGDPFQFHGYGFNDDHTGLEVLYSAPTELSASDIQAQARVLVARTIEQVGSEPEFDLDFVEVSGPGQAEDAARPPEDLTCYTNRRTSGIFDHFLSGGGEESPEGAARTLAHGDDIVVDAAADDGPAVWVLRPDETAHTRLGLRQFADGTWIVESMESCRDGVRPSA